MLREVVSKAYEVSVRFGEHSVAQEMEINLGAADIIALSDFAWLLFSFYPYTGRNTVAGLDTNFPNLTCPFPTLDGCLSVQREREQRAHQPYLSLSVGP